MSTATYAYKNKSRLLQTIPGVLTPVVLADLETTSNSPIITISDTTGLFPGMAIHAPNIPRGAFIHAVLSSTQLELWASNFDRSTGVLSTSSDNAKATASASGLTGHASGINMVPVTDIYALGTWTNSFLNGIGYGIGTYSDTKMWGIVPGGVSGGVYTDPTRIAMSDELRDEPNLRRHNAEPWGFWTLVSTGGFISSVPANEQCSLCLVSIQS